MFRVALALLSFVITVPALADEALDPSGLPGPAWYSDTELADTWKRLTGKYIFQRACTSCHAWGPDHLTRSEWEDYLGRFPGNHETEIGETYDDLTASFVPATYVPTLEQQHEALLAFLRDAAPSAARADGEDESTYEGFPAVGEMAPDIEIVDIEGHRHALADYRNKRKLVVVFSRAHW